LTFCGTTKTSRHFRWTFCSGKKSSRSFRRRFCSHNKIFKALTPDSFWWYKIFPTFHRKPVLRNIRLTVDKNNNNRKQFTLEFNPSDTFITKPWLVGFLEDIFIAAKAIVGAGNIQLYRRRRHDSKSFVEKMRFVGFQFCKRFLLDALTVCPM
jgi:hypothetical protein